MKKNELVAMPSAILLETLMKKIYEYMVFGNNKKKGSTFRR
jgi:hypothetical protein